MSHSLFRFGAVPRLVLALSAFVQTACGDDGTNPGNTAGPSTGTQSNTSGPTTSTAGLSGG
ncbi:MAG TPA: hypothetical protein VN764_00060, partial [Polyangiaceae bacterium]|nr:hypothetical protein [Polyangiaceae bacterium]